MSEWFFFFSLHTSCAQGRKQGITTQNRTLSPPVPPVGRSAARNGQRVAMGVLGDKRTA